MTDDLDLLPRETLIRRLRAAERGSGPVIRPEGPPTFRESELNNADFFRQHRAEILAAAVAGRIIPDDAPQSAPVPPDPAPAPSTAGSADGGSHGTPGPPRITAANLNDRAFYLANRAEIERRSRVGLPILDE